MGEYFGEQPWLALDYSDRKRKDQLSSLCKVEGIPSFVIFDKDGTLITRDGRAAVSGDPTGDEFPWYPKPVGNQGWPWRHQRSHDSSRFLRDVGCYCPKRHSGGNYA